MQKMDKEVLDSRKLKNVDLRTYEYKVNELPRDSYVLNHPAMTYASFVPFIVNNNFNLKEHQQLNWLNLFIYKKLGSWDSENSKLINAVAVNDNKIIQEEIQKLPSNIAQIIKPNPTIIIDNTPVNVKIQGLEQRLVNIEYYLEKLSQTFGIEKPTSSESKVETYTPNG